MQPTTSRFIQSLREEDLHPDLQVLVPMVGMEIIRTILEHFPGQTFYFGFASRMTEAVRRFVAQNYQVDDDGRNNARELARDCGVTPQHIRKIYKELRDNA